VNVNLTPQLEAMVRRKVEGGQYNNASEVVREALRLMQERDEERDSLARLRAAVAAAQEQFDRGEGREWTPELHEEIKRQAAENARLGVPIPDDVKP
jgi:antitoxin ParD1/3/4